MKRFWIIVGFLTLAAALSYGQDFKIGGHGAYSTGGDVEDEEIGYGAQLQAVVNENFSIEASGTMFEDFDGEIEITTIAISARLGVPLADGVLAYGGGGGNYNMFDVDAVDIDDEVGYHFCGGAEFLIADNIELFGEYRYSIVEISDDNVEDNYDFGLVRAGLNFVL